nr:hypothetical protein [uncultured Mediterraneibacter sp.]
MLDYIIALTAGIVIGTLVTMLHYRVRTGYGYFKLEPVPDEPGLYTVNMRLVSDQDLKHKDQITLTRE